MVYERSVLGLPLPGSFHLGQFSRHLFMDPAFFLALACALYAPHHLADVEPAARRCPIRRLPLHRGQIEVFVKLLLERQHEHPLLHAHPEDRDVRRRLDLELQRGSPLEAFPYAFQ